VIGKLSKQFRKGLVYVFTMKKYKKDSGNKQYLWARKANGRKVDVRTELTENGYRVCPEWCKCIGKERR
jgi:hypothetical protein